MKNFQWLGPVRSLNCVVAHVRFFFLSGHFICAVFLSQCLVHHLPPPNLFLCHLLPSDFLSALYWIQSDFTKSVLCLISKHNLLLTVLFQWHSLSLPFIWCSCCQMSDIHVASQHIVINLSHPLKMWCLDGCNDWLANKVLSDVFITSVLSGYLLWMPNMLYQTTPLTSSMGFNSEWTEINTENAFKKKKKSY